MFESLTWPLRKLAWKFEEKVIWRIGDAIRGRPAGWRSESDYVPAQTDLTAPAPQAPRADAANTGRRDRILGPPRLRLPAVSRLRASGRDVGVALATVTVAVGAGVAIATLLDSEGDEGAAPAAAVAPSAPGPQPAPQGEAAQPTTLQGVAPSFGEGNRNQGGAAAERAPASPTESTNTKPSAIPPVMAGNMAAMETARDFAGAFVLYEVGKFNRKVRRTFTRTATPTLAKALQDRPPRLPDSVQVPTAKVQNVVLGTPRGRTMEASISLLRLGDISELRLTMSKRKGDWRVSEVRG